MVKGIFFDNENAESSQNTSKVCPMKIEKSSQMCALVVKYNVK
jgi:hypothetical protein